MKLQKALFSLILSVCCMIAYVIYDPMGWTSDVFVYTQYDGDINEQLQRIEQQKPTYLFSNKHRLFQMNSTYYDDKMDLNLDISAIPINEIRDQWQLMFHDIFINHELLPILLQNDQYSSSIDQFLPDNNTLNLNDSIKIFNELLDTTNTFFSSSPNDIINKLFILLYHRQIISIRRYIMILYKYLMSKTAENNSINQQIYTSLIQDIFLKIRLEYTDIIKNDDNYNKYWYLIHLSKSAGTSICRTQRDIGYAQLKDLGTNCNIPGYGVPIKNQDIGPLSCNELEHIRESEDIEFIASERPMDGHKISNKPTLCSKYHYIFPIRNPLRRIASTLIEYNTVKNYFPFQMLTIYGDNDKGFDPIQYAKSQRFRCFKRLITLNHNKTYGSLRNIDDYNDFVTHLFENEEKEDQVDVVWHNNFNCRKESNLDDEYHNLYKHEDQTYITWLGDDRKYAIKITEGFKDRSNVSLLRGYSSNTYTRWIGYQRMNGSETTYDAIFDKSYNINITHWFEI